MPYRCKLCGEVFKDLGDAQMHLMEHDTELLEEIEEEVDAE